MPSYYDSEVEKQKKSKLDTILPILAAIEAVGTSISSKGRNVTGNTLDLWKGVQGQREAALERALGRDKSAADAAREAKILGFQAEAAGRAKSEYEREGKAREAETARIGALKRKLLGTPEEMDSASGVMKPAVPGIADLTDLDKAAIDADPVGWLTNKLKPLPTQLVVGADNTYQPVVKTTGKTPDGKTVTAPPPRPSSIEKTPEQIAAEAKARALGTAAAEREVAGKTSIPGLTAIPGATITNDGVKKVQDIAVRKDELVKSIDRLQQLYDKHGTEIYGDAAREMESLVKGIQLTAKEFYNLGVLNGPDLGLMESIIPNPTAIRTKAIGMIPGAGDPVGPKLKEARNLIADRFKSTINRYGFQEAGGNSGQVPEGTEITNVQGVKMRMTGGKWRVAQ